jgi:hypothetical protein
MYDNPIYAYKGFVYKIEAEELEITERYMRFRDSGEKIDLSSWGEITLNEFKEIVDTYLNTEPM